ncbi:hypothetical protein DL95DRAFT_384391, partial [Leptodontidium sp. 2 PMI_412]
MLSQRKEPMMEAMLNLRRRCLFSPSPFIYNIAIMSAAAIATEVTKTIISKESIPDTASLFTNINPYLGLAVLLHISLWTLIYFT